VVQSFLACAALSPTDARLASNQTTPDEGGGGVPSKFPGDHAGNGRSGDTSVVLHGVLLVELSSGETFSLFLEGCPQGGRWPATVFYVPLPPTTATDCHLQLPPKGRKPPSFPGGLRAGGIEPPVSREAAS